MFAVHKIPKSRFITSAPPSVTDDSSKDFEVNSQWLYQGILYICSDTTIGAAVWSSLSSSTPFILTIDGDDNALNDVRILTHGKNNYTPTVILWYMYDTGKWRMLDNTQGITTETATPNQLTINLLAYEGNKTTDKYRIIIS